jgi:hypothetical protein
MKRLAARDFEDLLQVSSHIYTYNPNILQCSIPVFEGLLPGDENDIVLDLLFDFATWHAYAKLRLHTDTTLNNFDTVTKVLGSTLRTFAKEVCIIYDTRELPHEETARVRQAAKQANLEAANGTISEPIAHPPVASTGRKRRELNLSTYKLHALGDYPNTIRRFGTTDSYSTQSVCKS